MLEEFSFLGWSNPYEKGFAYRGPAIWNSLPRDIKSFRTFGSFKSKLKAMLTGKDWKIDFNSLILHTLAVFVFIRLCKPIFLYCYLRF